VQDRLVRMRHDVTAMQLYCIRLARLAEAGRVTDGIAGLAKVRPGHEGQRGKYRRQAKQGKAVVGNFEKAVSHIGEHGLEAARCGR